VSYGPRLSGRLEPLDQRALITERAAFSGQTKALVEAGVRVLAEIPLGADGLTGVIGAGLTAAGQVFARSSSSRWPNSASLRRSSSRTTS